MGENGHSRYQVSLVESEIEAPKRKIQHGRRSSFVEDDESMVFPHSFSLDPIKIEHNRLTNEIKEKDRELEETLNEIKSLRLTERAKDKALSEVMEELYKLCGKLEASEATIENKGCPSWTTSSLKAHSNATPCVLINHTLVTSLLATFTFTKFSRRRHHQFSFSLLRLRGCHTTALPESRACTPILPHQASSADFS